MALTYRSFVETSGDADIIYYNADIINNITRDTGSGEGRDPLIRFNETRDTALVKNASQYYFSIVRFVMNGPNKDLPLFIPQIQLNRGGVPQTNPNLTIYQLAIAYQREWAYTSVAGPVAQEVFTITPAQTPLIYRPETQNAALAPVPQIPLTGFTTQDLSTRYYWVYTYKHWADLVNETLLTAMNAVFVAFQTAWNANPNINLAASPFPYANLAAFLADHDVPFVYYDEETRLFSIYGDTRAFNVAGEIVNQTNALGQQIGVQQSVPAFVPPVLPPAPIVATAVSAPFLRLFFNSNLYGLLTNFKNVYYNTLSLRFPLTPAVLTPLPFPDGYTNEICFANQQYTNLLNNNPLLQGSQAVPPPAYNPYFLIPTTKQNLYWIAKQDYPSTGSLWSPIGSIVFTSSLLPVKNENVGQPVIFGEGNLGFSQPTSQSAFDPIITDIALDNSVDKAEGYRDFISYLPTAEYRMCAMTTSPQEIRNIDIQVFWRNRLNNQLYPISMFNQSSVSLKVLFRRIGYTS